jgi:hypothetical protein
MISEFSTSPKPQNNNAKILLVSLFVLSAILLLISASLDAYRGLVSAAGLIPLTAALFIYVKFLSSVYYYDIFIDGDGVPLFIVRQVTGKKSVTLCRVELSTIIKAEFENRSEKAKRKRDSVPVYSYCPTIFPREVIRLYLSGYGGKSEVVIEGNTEFCSLISKYSEEARANTPADE